MREYARDCATMMPVRRTFLLTLCAALMFLGAQAQVSGVPPSVTSLGPGRSFAPPASVTSLGPRGFTNAPILLGAPIQFHPGLHRRGGSFGGRRGNVGPIFIPYAVPVGPVYYGDGSEYYMGPQGAPVAPEAAAGTNLQTGPAAIAVPQMMPPDESRYGTHYMDQRETAAAPVEPPQRSDSSRQSAAVPEPETILVFKDGHRLQVTNYAIQGSTLFNLSGEGPRKIALADLDVDATSKANDDLGIDFHLP